MTWHVNIASRPTAAVILAIGAENFGSVERLTFEVSRVSNFKRWRSVNNKLIDMRLMNPQPESSESVGMIVI